VKTTPIAAIARSTWMDSRRPARNAGRSSVPATVVVVIVVTQHVPYLENGRSAILRIGWAL
jgi:hypothetical protein